MIKLNECESEPDSESVPANLNLFCFMHLIAWSTYQEDAAMLLDVPYWVISWMIR